MPRWAILAIAAGTLAGCIFVSTATMIDGDADSVEVQYGSDVATALPVARKHCAEYARVPHLIDAGGNLARFACIAQ